MFIEIVATVWVVTFLFVLIMGLDDTAVADIPLVLEIFCMIIIIGFVLSSGVMLVNIIWYIVRGISIALGA